MSHNLLGRNGVELLHSIRALAPEFDIQEMLQSNMGIDSVDALTIAAEVGSASVLSIVDRPLAVLADTPTEEDRGPIINSRFFSDDCIAIDGRMLQVFVESFNGRSLFRVERTRAHKIALRLAGAFELGRLSARQVFKLYDRAFTTASLPALPNDAEGTRFYTKLAEEIEVRELRELSPDSPKIEYTHQARETYETAVRPERFCARAGIIAMSLVDDTINGDVLIERFKELVLNEHVYDVDGRPEFKPPKLRDIGALMPLSTEEFRLMCEFILTPPDNVAAIDRCR